MQRKIVQIAAAGHENTAITQSNLTLFALDEFGGVWCMDNRLRNWHQLPALPQDEPKTPKELGLDQVPKFGRMW